MDVLGTVLPVFLTLALGALCRARRLLSPEGIEAVKKVAVNVTLPAVSLAAFAEADYAPRNLLIPLWIFFCCCAALALGFAVRRRGPKALRGEFTPYLCTGFEGGMLGFALYPLLRGELAPFAIVDLGQVFFVFTVYKLLLSGARSPRALGREAAKSPSLWALGIGALLGASGLYAAMPAGARNAFDSTLDFLSAPTSFLILLSVGYELRPAQIPWLRSLAAVAARLCILAPLLGLTLLLNRFALGGAIDPAAAVLLFALPAPFVLPAFARGGEEERSFVSSTLSVMTCVTLALFTALAFGMR